MDSTAFRSPDFSSLVFDVQLSASALRRPWLAELAQAIAPKLQRLPAAPCQRAPWVLARSQSAPGAKRTDLAASAATGRRAIRVLLRAPASVSLETAAADIEHALCASGFAAQVLVGGLSVDAGLICTPQSPMPGLDLCLQLTTPWRLPCALSELNAPVLAHAMAERLSQWRGRCITPPDSTGVQLLWHFAQHLPGLHDVAGSQSAKGLHGKAAAVRGPYGQLQGALFLRGMTPSWLALLQAVQPLNLATTADTASLAWRGAFSLRWQQGPWLDSAVLNRRRLLVVAQQLVDHADTPPVLGAGGAVLGATQVADQLLEAARAGRYQPQPSEQLVIHNAGKQPRLVEKLAPTDVVWQQHLLQVLGPVCERVFHPVSYGFRPGLGRAAAVQAVRQALAQGYAQVFETDIANCFDSIEHPRLLARLDALLPASDTALRAALTAVLTQPCRMDGQVRARLSGLPQGAPLSPLLANLYLSALDEALARLPVRVVRYADDLVVLARSKADARQAQSLAVAVVTELGLKLSPEKTRLTHLQQGFTFLGETFDTAALEPVPHARPAQRKPLVVTWPYLQLGANGACVEARLGQQSLGQWPLRRLSMLVVLARCNVSSVLLERCAAHGVAVALAVQGGHKTLLLPPSQRQHLQQLHGHMTWHAALTQAARLGIAQALVDAKLANAATLVRQRAPRDPLLEALDETRRQLTRAGSVAALRGHEGQAARMMFQWLNSQILPALRPAFASRRRARGAPDRLNSLLNLAYHLLATRLAVLVRARGLNPYLGCLHDADDAYDTLVYDLMEPFRPLVDRLVLRLINRQEIRPQHFDGGADEQHRLKPAAAAAFAQAFEKALGERVGAHTWRDMVWAQVQATAAMVQGQGPLWVFQWQPREPAADMGGVEPAVWTLAADSKVAALPVADELLDTLEDPIFNTILAQAANDAPGQPQADKAA